jgi:hypothetical protein
VVQRVGDHDLRALLDVIDFGQREHDRRAADQGIQVIDCELARCDEPSRVSAADFAQLLVSLC